MAALPGEGATGYDRAAILEAAIRRRRGAEGASAPTPEPEGAPDVDPNTGLEVSRMTAREFLGAGTEASLGLLQIDFEERQLVTTAGTVPLNDIEIAALAAMALDAYTRSLTDQIQKVRVNFGIDKVEALLAQKAPAEPKPEKKSAK